MQITPSFISCGVHQLWSLADTKMVSYYPIHGTVTTTPVSIEWKSWGHTLARLNVRTRFLVFSDSRHYGHGVAVAAKFREYGYIVVETEEGINPNSENPIKTWVVKI